MHAYSDPNPPLNQDNSAIHQQSKLFLTIESCRWQTPPDTKVLWSESWLFSVWETADERFYDYEVKMRVILLAGVLNASLWDSVLAGPQKLNSIGLCPWYHYHWGTLCSGHWGSPFLSQSLPPLHSALCSDHWGSASLSQGLPLPYLALCPGHLGSSSLSQGLHLILRYGPCLVLGLPAPHLALLLHSHHFLKGSEKASVVNTSLVHWEPTNSATEVITQLPHNISIT